MLRITSHDTGRILTLQLEGRLAAPWLEELEKCWNEAVNGRRRSVLRVDLTGVTSIDARGKACLKAIRQEGAEFIAADCLMKAIVAEISDASNEQGLPEGDGDDPNTERKTRRG